MPEWTPAGHYDRHHRRQNPDPNEWLARFGMGAPAPANPGVINLHYPQAPAPAAAVPVRAVTFQQAPPAAAPAASPIYINIREQPQPAAPQLVWCFEAVAAQPAPPQMIPIQVVRRLLCTNPPAVTNSSIMSLPYSVLPRNIWVSRKTSYRSPHIMAQRIVR